MLDWGVERQTFNQSLRDHECGDTLLLMDRILCLDSESPLG